MRAVLAFSLFLVLAVGFLLATPGQAHPLAQATPPDPAQIFAENCAACHGEAGEGRSGPPLTHLQDHTDEELVRIISLGLPETGMPPWEGRLSPEEITALVGYLRTLGTGGDAEHEEEQPSSATAGDFSLDLSLSLEGEEILARAVLQDRQGRPLAGQEVSFNLLTALGGVLPLGQATTGDEGLAEFRYHPGEASSVRLEALYSVNGAGEPIRTQASLDLPISQEIPSLAPGLYSPVPPLFAVLLLAAVIGAVWLTYAWVGLQLLRIWLVKGHDREGRI